MSQSRPGTPIAVVNSRLLETAWGLHKNYPTNSQARVEEGPREPFPQLLNHFLGIGAGKGCV